jgi:hypothetical protein
MYAIDYLDNMVSCLAFPEREQNTRIRHDRILVIRRKVRSGKYDIAKHLDIVVDRLIEDILVQNPENRQNRGLLSRM